jgi:membrane-associated phospholipid phosphatase
MSEHAYPARSLRSRSSLHARRLTSTPSPWGALALAAACVVALAVIWVVAELVPSAHHEDAQLLYEFTTLERPKLDSAGKFLLHLLDPSLFILWAIALVAIAFVRVRPRVAVAIAAIMGLGPLTAEKLKPLLAHAHDQVGYVEVGPASWPSGHSTAAGVLMISALLVAPATLRVLVATLGAIFVAAVSVTLLILHWHLPSDVVGGWFVAAMWGSLAVAALRFGERVRPSRRSGDGRAAPS